MVLGQYEWRELNKWLDGVNLASFTGDDQSAVASWYAKIQNQPYHKPCSCNPQIFLDWYSFVLNWRNNNRASHEPQTNVEV
jgi:hypothetical protein